MLGFTSAAVAAAAAATALLLLWQQQIPNSCREQVGALGLSKGGGAHGQSAQHGGPSSGHRSGEHLCCWYYEMGAPSSARLRVGAPRQCKTAWLLGAPQHAWRPPVAGGRPPPPAPLCPSTAVAHLREPPHRLLGRLEGPFCCFTGGPRLVEGGPLPVAKFEGALLVVEKPEAAAEACEALVNACTASSNSSSNTSRNSSSVDGRLVLGYDTEHDPIPRKAWGGPFVGPPLRVLQLGAPGIVTVFLLGPLGGLPRSVASLLQDPSIIKATQGAPLEALRLRAEFGVVARGFFCLHRASSLLQRCQSASRGPHSVLGAPPGARGGPFRGLSLRALCALYLKEQLDKQQQQSNWGGPLTEQQLLYAATDADASRRVYLALAESLGPHKMGALERCMGAPYNGVDSDLEGGPPTFATLSRPAENQQPHHKHLE
ncbi:hypothetical protein Esti_005034 [Eimeria stiedai]